MALQQRHFRFDIGHPFLESSGFPLSGTMLLISPPELAAGTRASNQRKDSRRAGLAEECKKDEDKCLQ
jgi:hypothetical protein